ncbi:hypothetical protein RMCBS344292_10586 [Rhizopus microsporus]|nr:hypothetical protein RMCBS344292_10586 [Rhizopus microsporus]
MPLLKPSSTTVTTIEIMVDGTKIIRTKTVKRLKKKGVILETFGLTLHIWPYHSLKLQLFAALSVLLMLANLAVNIWLPYKIGLITDGDMKEGQFAWLSIVVYVGLIYLQGHVSSPNIYNHPNCLIMCFSDSLEYSNPYKTHSGRL